MSEDKFETDLKEYISKIGVCKNLSFLLDFYHQYDVIFHPYVYIHLYFFEHCTTDEDKEHEFPMHIFLKRFLQLESLDSKLEKLYSSNINKYEKRGFIALLDDYLIQENILSEYQIHIYTCVAENVMMDRSKKPDI